MQDEPSQYHAAAAYVYIGDYAFTLAEIWDGIEAAEDNGLFGVSLDQIGRALARDWPAAVTALALKDFAALRALIEAVGP
jgi:hypothetical protein